MIGRLRGVLVELEGARATLDVSGVGYEILMPESVLVQLPPMGEEVTLRIRQVFREDGVSLYGFLEAFQRRLFDLLTEVKGCGPKIGLALIGQLGEDTVAHAIQMQDARTLARATGVGPRLAERIVLELRDKIQEELLHRKVGGIAPSRAVAQIPGKAGDALLDALLDLGYRRQEAEPAAELAKQSADSIEDQLKLALRSLMR